MFLVASFQLTISLAKTLYILRRLKNLGTAFYLLLRPEDKYVSRNLHGT